MLTSVLCFPVEIIIALISVCVNTNFSVILKNFILIFKTRLYIMKA
nr:MAG TPA: hypothetical protein [Caudoviricetes sp.]